ncbi:hypothetical protein HBI25_116100 [Parastagonospora nodorum]|nr:hypothetical protein HBH53_102580 [Parastagonospora nodorum]KAH3956476.1 hypothetical protein HBH51_240990 [Parastagonospora nodorum]KAH4120310.1 hypothetical protein HBH47_109590 [Parastagonospora nodorum]KAH4169564.1 hypothetical protein HBH43_119190 [Parastagonospora nodorum]KAH4215156.1 hypothetical protein HBI95_018010 [Parastagonospora nodorum]
MSANRHRVRILLGLLATLGLLVTFSSHGAERICPSSYNNDVPQHLPAYLSALHTPSAFTTSSAPYPTLPYPTLHTPTTPPQIRHSHPSSSHLTHNVRIRPK